MKELIKGKIMSADELAKHLTVDNETGITYDDVEKILSREDLVEYNELCECFVNSVDDKSNEDQWNMLLHPTAGLELVSMLDKIQEIREKYALPGVFHRLWRATPLKNGNYEYDEISW